MNAYLINTETMDWPIYEGELALLHQNTSFPIPLIDPPVPYAWVQDAPPPQCNWLVEDVREVTPIENNGIWRRTWEVYTLSQEQIAANEKQSRRSNKIDAESLLQATDWTENPSVRNAEKTPHLLNGDEFDDYRVALRIIAVNPPIVVELWPTKPEEVWSTNQG